MGWPDDELRDFYERQVVRLLDLARVCTDSVVQRKLTAMASEYIHRLERLTGQPSSEHSPGLTRH